MKPFNSPAWGKTACTSLLCLVFLALALPASASDQVWVRIHHAASDPGLQGAGLDHLADYGRFQWGPVDASRVDSLRSQGLRVTATENPFVLTLGDERVDPLDAGAMEAAFQPYAADPSGDWHIVQFQGPVRSQWVRDLRATGLEVAQPLHPYSYVVWGTEDQIQAARSLSTVRWSGPKKPEYKVQPRFREFGPETRPTMALISRHDLDGTLAAMEQAGATIHSNTRLSRHFEVIHLDVAGNSYLELGGVPGVYTVQYIQQDAGHRGEMSNQKIVRNLDGDDVIPGYAAWLTDTGYDGDGVIAGIVDGGIEETHDDLSDRIVPCTGTEGSCTTSGSFHGTHVGGAVAGTGASGVTDSAGFLRGQGVAPGAGLVNQAYSPFLGSGPGGMVPEGMLRIYKDSADSGAILSNNSWGPTGSPQGYDIPTMEIDFISRDALPDEPGHAPVLAVWSIMNGSGDSSGACAPSSLGSPDEAKNLFGVGSTNMQDGVASQHPDIFSVSSNSGHGPACDGRRVPDIVAPGCQTDSTSTGNGHGLACGTSMASPVVTGAIAVWAERYIDETGTNPSPALMKAVFIAAAEDLVGGTDADGGTLDHRPDRKQGFGLVNLEEVMNPAGNETYLMDQEVVFDEVGQDWSLALNAADPAEPMKIMLTWTDAPGHGDGGTAPAWVNILDLEVDALDGNTYLGNVVGPDGFSEPGGSPDDMNNTEGVWLRADQHQGGVDVTVIASELAGDALNPHDPGDPSQDFAIACHNCIVGDPTFSLSLDPASADFCVPDSGSDDLLVDINVGQIGDYSGTVSLSSSGEPAGVSSDIDPDSVVVPGSSTWTLTIDDTAVDDDYSVTVTGNDGDDVHETELALNLDEFLDNGPTLTNPPDGITDIILTPEFTWEALAGVDDYQIQVATDAGFTNVVIDELVEGTEFTPADELETGTEYFWRVQGVNTCGGGEWSDTFEFQTRFEPVADLSQDEFSFIMEPGDSDSQMFTLSNVGTGNLTWDIDLDEVPTMGNARGFDGDFAIENWELVNNPAGVGGSVDIEDGPPIEVYVIGGDDGTGGDTDFQIEIPMDGTITFDWGYQSEDSACWDSGGYAINGVFTELACNDEEVPYFDESETVEVSEGDLFAFRVHTVDGLLGAGTFGVTNFGFAPDACDDLSTPTWLSVDPTGGSIAENGSEEITVTVDSQGMVAGEYLGYMCLTTNDPNAALVPMPVELELTGDPPEDPVADITPASFEFTVAVDGTATDVLNVGNLGDSDLTWSIEQAEPAGVAYGAAGATESFSAPTGFPRGSGMEPDGQADAHVPAAVLGGPITDDWEEGFEDINTLPAAGWEFTNNSDPLGTTGWFQGDPANFPAHEGPDDSWIAANYQNGDAGGIISNWLITPEVALENGTELRFWTRHSTQTTFPDRMQVRLSTAGDSTDVGNTAESVGDFDNLLLDINEDMEYPGYPEVWTEFVVIVEDLPEPTTGRFAFRYYSPNWDEVGSLIGIDTFSISQPEGDPVGCDNPLDIDWLDINPAAGTTAPGSAEPVDVTVDADGLAEGDYEALLCVTTNDPDAELVEVPISLSVEPADQVGTVEGNVMSQGYCADNPAPAAGAGILIQGQSGSTFHGTADGDGNFQITVPADESPVSVTAIASDHLSGSVEDVEVQGGATTTVDFDLVLDAPCATVEPPQMSFALPAGASSSQILTIGNIDGGATLTWWLDSGDGCWDPDTNNWLTLTGVVEAGEPGGNPIAAGSVQNINATADTGDLEPGLYETTICIDTDDDQMASFEVPVDLEVLPDAIFEDRFEAPATE